MSLLFPDGCRQRRQWTIQNTGIEDFCQSFDLILADVNTNQNELKRLSARPIDTKRVAASRKTKTNISSGAITQGHFSVDIITAVGWLDVLDVDIHTPPPAGDSAAVGSASIVVTLTLASTGFLPLKVPGASLFNVLFCWVPFLSVEQSQRLLFFKEKVNARHVIEHEEVLCHY